MISISYTEGCSFRTAIERGRETRRTRRPRVQQPMPTTAGTTDSGVLARIAAGDEAAVHEAMNTYGALVWSLAKRMCRNRAEAEDAVQDIFVSIWRSADRFNPEAGSEATFIAVIARRKLIDRLRARTRRPEPVALTDAAPGAIETNSSTELTEEAKIAAEAFNELTPDQQRVLRLSVHQGCTHEEIAASLEMPLGTVKTHCRRGMIKIRESLERRQAKGSRAGVNA